MSDHNLISVPENMKAVVKATEQVTVSEAFDMPEAIKASVINSEELAVTDVIEQVPDVELYQIPRHELGKGVVKAMIVVPGATGAKVAVPGTPVEGRVREVVRLGGLSDFKGGNPGNKRGFNGTIRK